MAPHPHQSVAPKNYPPLHSPASGDPGTPGEIRRLHATSYPRLRRPQRQTVRRSRRPAVPRPRRRRHLHDARRHRDQRRAPEGLGGRHPPVRDPYATRPSRTAPRSSRRACPWTRPTGGVAVSGRADQIKKLRAARLRDHTAGPAARPLQQRRRHAAVRLPHRRLPLSQLRGDDDGDQLPRLGQLRPSPASGSSAPRTRAGTSSPSSSATTSAPTRPSPRCCSPTTSTPASTSPSRWRSTCCAT